MHKNFKFQAAKGSHRGPQQAHTDAYDLHFQNFTGSGRPQNYDKAFKTHREPHRSMGDPMVEQVECSLPLQGCFDEELEDNLSSQEPTTSSHLSVRHCHSNQNEQDNVNSNPRKNTKGHHNATAKSPSVPFAASQPANNLNLERRSSEMLSEPVLNYDLPLSSSSRMHVTRLSIPDCGNQCGPNTYSNPITQSVSQVTTAAKNTPMNSLQNTIKSKLQVGYQQLKGAHMPSNATNQIELLIPPPVHQFNPPQSITQNLQHDNSTLATATNHSPSQPPNSLHPANLNQNQSKNTLQPFPGISHRNGTSTTHIPVVMSSAASSARRQQLQAMQQSLYVGLGCREIEEGGPAANDDGRKDECMQEIKEEQVEDTQMTLAEENFMSQMQTVGMESEMGSGGLAGRFDTETMDRYIKKVNQDTKTNKQWAQNYNNINQNSSQMSKTAQGMPSQVALKKKSTSCLDLNKEVKGDDLGSRQDQLSSDRLDTQYFKENALPTQQTLQKIEQSMSMPNLVNRNDINTSDDEDNNDETKDIASQALQIPDNQNNIKSGALMFLQPSPIPENKNASICVTSASQKIRASKRSSDFSSITNDNYQFLSNVHDIGSTPRGLNQNNNQNPPSDYVAGQFMNLKKRKSRFVSLDGPGQSIKIPSLPSESTQGLSNLLNSKGQIILSGTNNEKFMLVPLHSKLPLQSNVPLQTSSKCLLRQSNLSPINKDYHSKNNSQFDHQSSKYLKNGTGSSLQSKHGPNQQYQMISFGPEEGHNLRLHSQSTPRMKFTQNSKTNDAVSSSHNHNSNSSQQVLTNLLLSKQQLNQVQHLGTVPQAAPQSSAAGASSGCLSLHDLADKLCARVAAKDICLSAEQVHNFMELQKEQLVIVLNEEDDIDTKLQKLVEALNNNNNKSKVIASENGQRVKGKNNLEILQEIKKIFQRIIDVQLTISQKENIYLKFAGEVERNQLLREELESHNLLLQTKDQEIEQLMRGMNLMQQKISIQSGESQDFSTGQMMFDYKQRQLNRSKSVPSHQLYVQGNYNEGLQNKQESARYVETSCSNRGMINHSYQKQRDLLNGYSFQLQAQNQAYNQSGLSIHGQNSHVSSLSASKMFKQTKSDQQTLGQEINNFVQNEQIMMNSLQHTEPGNSRRQQLQNSQVLDQMVIGQPFEQFSENSLFPSQLQDLLAAKDQQIQFLIQSIDQMKSDQAASSNNNDLSERLLTYLGSIERKVENLAKNQNYPQTVEQIQDFNLDDNCENQDYGEDHQYNKWIKCEDSSKKIEGMSKYDESSSRVSRTSDQDSDILSKCVDIKLPQPTDLDEEPQMNQQHIVNYNTFQERLDSSPGIRQSKENLGLHDLGQPIEVNTVQGPNKQFLSFQSNLSKITGPYINSTTDAPNTQRKKHNSVMKKQINELQDQVKQLVGVVKDLQQQLQGNQTSTRSKGGTLQQHGCRTGQFNAIVNSKSSPSDNPLSSRSSNKLEHTFQLKQRSQSQLTKCSSKPSVAQRNNQTHKIQQQQEQQATQQPQTVRLANKMAHRHTISHDQLTHFQTQRQPNNSKEQSSIHTTSISDSYVKQNIIHNTSPTDYHVQSSLQNPIPHLNCQKAPPILPFHTSLISPTKPHRFNPNKTIQTNLPSTSQEPPSQQAPTPTPLSNLPTPESLDSSKQPASTFTKEATPLSSALLHQELSRLRQSHLQTVDTLQRKHRENIQKLSSVIKVLEGRLTQMNQVVTEQRQSALTQVQKNQLLVSELRAQLEDKSSLIKAQSKDLQSMKHEVEKIRQVNSERRVYLRDIEEQMYEKERGTQAESQKQEEFRNSLINSLKEQDMARKIDSEIWGVEKRQLHDKLDDLERQLKDEQKLHRKALKDNKDLVKSSKEMIDKKDGQILQMRDDMLSLQIEMKTLEKQTEYELYVRQEAWNNDMQKLKSKHVQSSLQQLSMTRSASTGLGNSIRINTDNSVHHSMSAQGKTTPQDPTPSHIPSNQALQMTVYTALNTLSQTYSDFGEYINNLCLKFAEGKQEDRVIHMLKKTKELERRNDEERKQMKEQIQTQCLKVMELKQLVGQMKLVISQKDVLIRRMKELYQMQNQNQACNNEQEPSSIPRTVPFPPSSHDNLRKPKHSRAFVSASFDNGHIPSMIENQGTMPSFRMLSGRNHSCSRGGQSIAMTSTISENYLDQPLLTLVQQLKSGHQNLSKLLEKKNTENDKLRKDYDSELQNNKILTQQITNQSEKLQKQDKERGGLQKIVDATEAIISNYDLASLLNFKVIPNDLDQKIHLLLEQYQQQSTKLQTCLSDLSTAQTQLEKQRKLLQSQIDSLESELSQQQHSHIKSQEESSLENCRKERELESEIQGLRAELERAKKELEYMERQESKFEKQRRQGQERIGELEGQVEYLKGEMSRGSENYEREKNLNMDLSVKVKKMEDVVDKKVSIIDKLQSENIEMSKSKKENDDLKLKIMKMEGEIKLMQESRLSKIGFGSLPISSTEQSVQKVNPSLSIHFNSDMQHFKEQNGLTRDKSRDFSAVDSFNVNGQTTSKRNSKDQSNDPILVLPKQLQGCSITSLTLADQQQKHHQSSSVSNLHNSNGLSQSEQISHLIAQIRYQDRKIQEMQTKISQVGEFEQKIEQLILEKQELHQTIDETEHEALTLKDQNYQLQIDIQHQNNTIQYFEQQQQEYQQQISDLSNQLTEYKHQLSILQNALRSTACDVRKAVNEAQTFSTETNEDIIINGKTVAESDRSQNEKKLKKEIAALTKKLEETKMVKKEYKSEVRKSRETIIRYRQEFANLQKEKQELVKQVTKLQQQLRAAKNQKVDAINFAENYNNLSYTSSDQPYTVTNRQKNDNFGHKHSGAKDLYQTTTPDKEHTKTQINNILVEKDNYISNIEEENGKLRLQNEKLKDKIIQLEIDSIGNGLMAKAK